MPENSMVKMAKTIFESLPVHSSMSVAELSRQANIAWTTAKKWLELIEYIQGEDDLQIHKVSGGNLEYSRKGKMGRPSKR